MDSPTATMPKVDPKPPEVDLWMSAIYLQNTRVQTLQWVVFLGQTEVHGPSNGDPHKEWRGFMVTPLEGAGIHGLHTPVPRRVWGCLGIFRLGGESRRRAARLSH